MKRAKSLDTVTFSMNTLFIQEEFTDNSLLAEAKLSAAGTRISYVAVINTPNITLDSKEYGWIKEEEKNLIDIMFLDIDSTFILTYNDDTTDEVMFRHEVPPSFTATHEGSQTYTAIIPLVKVSP